MYHTLTEWSFTFYIYSILGWFWEVLFAAVRKRRMVNRGFLRGPWLPIYGSGAVGILLITGPVRESLLLIFLMGMLGATVLEYVTGESLAHWFHLRYWDYSDKKLNLNGHICLAVTLGWGVFTVALQRVIHPLVESLLWDIPLPLMGAVNAAVSVVFAIDVIQSVYRTRKQGRKRLPPGAHPV